MAITGRTPLAQLLAVANSYHEPEAADENAPTGPNWLPAHDHLDNAEAAVEFLGRNAIQLRERPQPRHLVALRRIREAARLLPQNERAYERRTARLLQPARYQLQADGRLVSPRSGWDGFIDDLLVALVELRDHHARLKVCGNDQCRWLFLDRSKNQSRQWCESSTCGNRQRVRRFRERQGAA